MKKELVTYIQSLGIRTPLEERIKRIYEFYQALCPDEITDMFIEDYFKENGTREYEGLWFFSGKYVMEAKTFIKDDDFDMAQIEKRLNYWRIKKQDYDFKQATDKSRMHLDAAFEGGTMVIMKAAKANCDALRDIFMKYFLPNLKGYERVEPLKG